MKRPADNDGKDTKKQRKYRKDGSQVQLKSFSPPEGPGIFVTCVRGKEKQAMHDILDILNDICDRFFPDLKVQPRKRAEEKEGEKKPEEEGAGDAAVDGETATTPKESAESDIKAQLAAELEEMNSSTQNTSKKPQHTKNSTDLRRFVNHPTDTQCMIYLEVRRPFNPIDIVETYLDEVEQTGKMRTKYIQRLTPVSHVAHASENAFEALCAFTFQNYLDASKPDGSGGSYRIELRARSHNTLKRDFVIQKIVDSIRAPHRIDLSHPDRWCIVEVFKSVVGVSVVSSYEKYRKFNPFSIVEAKNKERVDKEGKKDDGNEKVEKKEASEAPQPQPQASEAGIQQETQQQPSS